MKALSIHAGPRALEHLAQQGLQPRDVGVVPAAAGGPKGLILGPLDRFIFGHWLTQSQQPVHLVGASIGAWRMATACLNDPVAALLQLEDAYVHQHYEVPPGKKRPPAAHVSERFGQSLQAFYAGRVDEVLQHPRYRLHLIAARGRHLLRREHPVATPLGYLGAFMSNAVHRKALGAWLERVVFSSSQDGAPGGAAMPTLPFGTADFRTRQVRLTHANFMDALQASCSIPFVLQAVHHIAGAPPGAYWDGGLTDYHMHLAYKTHQGSGSDAIEKIAASADSESASGPFHSKKVVAASDQGAGLVLYPHFQHQVVPGWLDKGLRWRHRSTAALDTMVVLSPRPEWVKTLPNAKLPDRQDFMHYGHDTAARAKAWLTATAAAQQLADELAQWLERPDLGAVQPL
ncbi:patatin-like phospholipase family protein [Acidovorax sp. 106]|uniref:patatin-like phospholipase family protein n=1 Tax=Acidovorax sp. 106 TaxID=2135637 RepID=UPI000EB507E9|nr:patatin-like phospholipase family protein [Acidovorax sp. 106]RLJ40273.1 patatin-like phospholipase [Acidovorax sp. 106]